MLTILAIYARRSFFLLYPACLKSPKIKVGGPMFKFLLKDKIIDTIVSKITMEVNQALGTFQAQQDEKLEKVLTHLESMRIELKTIDDRLTTKEMRDKMDYGQMQYKISSLQNELNDKNPDKKRQAN